MIFFFKYLPLLRNIIACIISALVTIAVSIVQSMNRASEDIFGECLL
jgi:hypothetical protein